MPKNELKDKILNEIATGATAQECADKYNIPAGTIRSWLFRNKNNKCNVAENKPATKRKKATQRKNVATEKKGATAKEKEPVIKLEDISEELTEKQRLFCLYYVKYWNAGKAAKKAGYKCSYPNGFYEIGSQLLKNPQVKAEIDKFKQNIREGIAIEAMAIFQKYVDIACSDITDFLTFGQREVQCIGPFGPLYEGEGEDKKPVKKVVNFVDLVESGAVDGTLISEVSQGKDGIKIKLADKMKALEKLEKYFDLFPDKFKRRIEEEKLKLQREAVEKENGKTPEQGVMIVDDIK
jgi:phage terminase small subunit